jgi:hypothetical protein
MKGGPKPDPVGHKLARGTYRADRDQQTVQICVAGDPPAMPDYLTAEAQAVWVEEIGRVMAVGTVEIDSSIFGRYCSLEALARRTFSIGEPVPAAYLAELRRTAELFGLAGPKSRTLRRGAGEINPFTRNGRRPAAGEKSE